MQPRWTRERHKQTISGRPTLRVGMSLELAAICAQAGFNLLVAAHRPEIRTDRQPVRSLCADVTVVETDSRTTPALVLRRATYGQVGHRCDAAVCSAIKCASTISCAYRANCCNAGTIRMRAIASHFPDMTQFRDLLSCHYSPATSRAGKHPDRAPRCSSTSCCSRRIESQPKPARRDLTALLTRKNLLW